MGMYADVRRRHRGLGAAGHPRSAMGGVVLFFALLLDDVTKTHVDHYQTLGVWLGSHGSDAVGALVLDVEGGGTRAVWRVGIHHDFGGEEEDNAQFLQELQETPDMRAGRC